MLSFQGFVACSIYKNVMSKNTTFGNKKADGGKRIIDGGTKEAVDC